MSAKIQHIDDVPGLRAWMDRRHHYAETVPARPANPPRIIDPWEGYAEYIARLPRDGRFVDAMTFRHPGALLNGTILFCVCRYPSGIYRVQRAIVGPNGYGYARREGDRWRLTLAGMPAFQTKRDAKEWAADSNAAAWRQAEKAIDRLHRFCHNIKSHMRREPHV